MDFIDVSWKMGHEATNEEFVGNTLDVSKNRGTPKRFIMETPIKIHDLGGQPLFLETPICGKPFLSQIRCAK